MKNRGYFGKVSILVLTLIILFSFYTSAGILNLQKRSFEEKTIQGHVIIGRPVVWTKEIINPNHERIEILIPQNATNIKIKKNSSLSIEEIDYTKVKIKKDGEEIPLQKTNPLTGLVILGRDLITGMFTLSILKDDNNSLGSVVQEDYLNLSVGNSLLLRLDSLDLGNDTSLIQWYVDGVAVSSNNSLSYNFSADREGSFEVKSLIKDNNHKTLVRKWFILAKLNKSEESNNPDESSFPHFSNFENITGSKNNSKILVIEDIADAYEIVYTTPGPQKTEEAISKGKRIIISSEIHYENIFTYTNIPESNRNSIKLYRTTGGIKEPAEIVQYVDTNNNGLIDQIAWIVPHLSDQTYEVEINVFNVYSSPIVGGNWTVMFNTTGIANLTISAVNGTIYGDDLPSDLKPLELKCGDDLLDYSQSGNSVFHSNYSCDNTSYWTVKVLTEGKHYQEFLFGNDVAYAENWADNGSAVQYVDGCATLSTANAVYYLITNVSSGDSCFVVGANNITLDCQGNTISWGALNNNYHGGVQFFWTGRDNITVRNCNISQEGTQTLGGGIYARYSNGLFLENNIINGTGYGIYLSKGNRSTFYNNTITSTAIEGIFVDTGQYFNISLNKINASDDGIYFGPPNLPGDRNESFSVFDGNEIESKNSGNALTFNNYVAGCNITNSLFISESNKALSPSLGWALLFENITAISRGSGAGDYALDANCNNCTFRGGYYEGHGTNEVIRAWYLYDVSFEDLTVVQKYDGSVAITSICERCNYTNITVYSNDTSLYLNGKYQYILNCNLESDYKNGIYIWTTSSNASIINSTVVSNHSIAFWTYSYNATIIGNVFESRGSEYVIWNYNGLSDSIFYDNIVNGSSYYLSGSGDKLNISEKQPGGNVFGYDWIWGNFWTNNYGKGFSDSCIDADRDYICDEPFYVDSNSIDYHPLARYTSPYLYINSTAFDYITYANYSYFTANFTDGYSIIQNSTCYIKYQVGSGWSKDYNMSFNPILGLFEATANGSDKNGGIDNFPVGKYNINITCFNQTAGVITSNITEINVSSYATSLSIENSSLFFYQDLNIWFYANYTKSTNYENWNGNEIGELLWRSYAQNPEKILIGDDYIFACDLDSSPGRFTVFSFNGTNVFNNSGPSANAFNDCTLIDQDEDGRKNEVVAINNAGDLVWIYESNGSLNTTFLSACDSRGIIVKDVDNDGLDEMIITDCGADTRLLVYHMNRSLLYNVSIEGHIQDWGFGDLDGDGMNDDIAIQDSWDLSPSDISRVQIYNETFGHIFNSSNLGTYGYALGTGDLNNDGAEEIIVGTNTNLLVFNSSFYNYLNISGVGLGVGKGEIFIGDLDSDGLVDDILIGSNGTTDLRRVDSLGNINWSLDLDGGSIYSISYEDIDGDGYEELIVGGDGDILYVLESNGSIVKQFDALGDIVYSYSVLGKSPGIKVRDLNGDGIKDIIFSGRDVNKIYALELVSCQIQLNHTSNIYNMTWNQTNRRWELNLTLSKGSYKYNITCEKNGYISQIKSSEFTVVGIPEDPVVSLNFTKDGLNYTNDSMTCSFNLDDNNGNPLYVNISLIKNTLDSDYVEQWILPTIQYDDRSIGSFVIDGGNFTKDDYVVCQVQVCNEFNDCSNFVNSSSLHPINSPVTISDPLGNWSNLEEDFSSMVLNWSNNYTDMDDLEGNEIYVNWTYIMNDSSLISLNVDNDSNLISVTPLPNVSGTVEIQWTVLSSDGTNDSEVVYWTTYSLNDAPWWDEVGNSTATNINEDGGSQQVLLNYSVYFRDVEDDQTPASIILTTNESDITCSESNSAINCNPINNFSGDFIIVMQANDSGLSQITQSFEGYVINVNDPPSTPQLNLPLNGTILKNNVFELNWSNSTDIDMESLLNYTVQISNDSDFTVIEQFNNTVVETDNTTEYIVSALGDGVYYWRVLASDGEDNSSWSENRTFEVDTQAPIIRIDFPLNGSTQNALILEKDFNFTIDEPNLDSCWYELNSSGENITIENCALGNRSIKLYLVKALWNNISIWANDTLGHESWNITYTFTNTIPAVPNLTSPINNSQHLYSNLTFSWSNVTDSDLDPVTFDLRFLNDTFDEIGFVSNLSLNEHTNNSLSDGWVYWQVRSYDGYDYSLWSNESYVDNVIPYISLTPYPYSIKEPGETQVITIYQDKRSDWITNFNITVTGDDQDNSYTPTADSSNTTGGTYSYTYNIPDITPRLLTVTVYAWNSTVTENISNTTQIMVTRPLGPLVSTPRIKFFYPNRTYINETTWLTIVLDVDLDVLNKSVSVTYSKDGGPAVSLNLTNSSYDNTNFNYNFNYTFLPGEEGNYTVTATITDTNDKTNTSTFMFFVKNESSINLTTAGLSSFKIKDILSDVVLASGDVINQSFITGDYKIEMRFGTNGFLTVDNMSINETNLLLLNFSDLNETAQLPFNNTLAVDRFSMFSENYFLNGLNFVYDYNSILGRILNESKLMLYRCDSEDNCNWTTLNFTLDKINHRLSTTLNNFSVFLIAENLSSSPEVIIVSTSSSSGTSGGGSSWESAGIKVITPASSELNPLEMFTQDILMVPLTIKNIGERDLKNINIESLVNTKDMTITLDRTSINGLTSGSSEVITANIDTSFTEPGVYIARFKAMAAYPEVSDESDLVIAVVIREKEVEKEYNQTLERLIFAMDLFKEHPECLELQELLDRAKKVLDEENDFEKSKKMIEMAIFGCRDMISSITLKKEVPGKMPFTLQQIIILIVILGSVLALIIYLITSKSFKKTQFVHMKTKNSRKEKKKWKMKFSFAKKTSRPMTKRKDIWKRRNY